MTDDAARPPRKHNYPAHRKRASDRLGLDVIEETFAQLRVTHPDKRLVDIALMIPAIAEGRTRDTAKRYASRLQARAHVKIRMRELKLEQIKTSRLVNGAKVSRQRTRRETARIAYADPRSILRVDRHGRVAVKPSQQWSDDAAAAIQSVRNTADGPVVTFWDKPSALGKLGKMQGLFPDPALVPRHHGDGSYSIGRVTIFIPDNGRDPKLRPQLGPAPTGPAPIVITGTQPHVIDLTADADADDPAIPDRDDDDDKGDYAQ
jgi:hypothetical protein